MLLTDKYLWSGYTGSDAVLGAGGKWWAKADPDFQAFNLVKKKSHSSRSRYEYSEGKECSFWARIKRELYQDWDSGSVLEEGMLTWELKYEL